jgi:GMP synthase (glutamine-hydrolysing)
MIERWLGLDTFRDDLPAAERDAEIARIRAETLQHAEAMQSAADAVFNNFLDLIGTPARRRRALAASS